VRASTEAPLRDLAHQESATPSNRAHAEVLRGVVVGEPWADEALYDTLYPIVAAALQKILHRPVDYEDLVQSSFERIVRTLHRPGALEIENLGAWASTIAARVALDALRSRSRERGVFDRQGAPLRTIEEASYGPDPEHQIHVRQELQWLQGQLADMNAEQAEVMLLHDVLGFELSEIARVTGTSAAAAQKRLSRAHLELRRRAERRAKDGKR
jgi:RNA polymerase sigma-70 factor (ECF subfamily)